MKSILSLEIKTSICKILGFYTYCDGPIAEVWFEIDLGLLESDDPYPWPDFI